MQNADGGNSLRVVVTAKNGDGTANATSVPTAVVTGAPATNGCPVTKSTTAPIADLSPPARLQINAFDVTTGAINNQTQSFSLQVRIGSTCGVNIQGASVYVTAVPYNQFDIPAEKLTGSDGTATLSFSRLSGFPASSKQQQLTLFIRATKPGEDILAGVSTQAARRAQLLRLAPVFCARPRPSHLAARPPHLDVGRKRRDLVVGRFRDVNRTMTFSRRSGREVCNFSPTKQSHRCAAPKGKPCQSTALQVSRKLRKYLPSSARAAAGESRRKTRTSPS